ncbi:PP2C family protein-serine/threonine phosphatase [Actinomadura terrae]|uniref:PP2C family protein-serine/threonine phosphatase n=1 Tax=Actinomadura terrae TaxID=604353 RepID=UPI001FA7AE4A|nr:PP2C family protein-serine/threonine phosphatase [Actinomadura terrae]
MSKQEVFRVSPPRDQAQTLKAVAMVLTASRHYQLPAAEQVHLVTAAFEAIRPQPGTGLALKVSEADTGDDPAGGWRLQLTTGRHSPTEEILASVPLPEPPAPSPALRADLGAARHSDPADQALRLLDLLSEQRSRMEWLVQELERTDRGTLELHQELSQATERLREAGRTQARLLKAERHARAAAEAARSRLAFLAHAGATLSASLDDQQILGRLCALIDVQNLAQMTIWLGRDPCALLPHDAQSIEGPPSLARLAHTSKISHHATPHPPRTATTGGPVVTTAPDELLAIPLISRAQALGVITYRPLHGAFTPEDVAVYGELSRLSAVALDNAQRYQHEHDVAHHLQQAMLTDLPTPTPTPQAPHLSPAQKLHFHARYLPAEAGLNVGGDWYDVFHHPEGHTIAAIGDVTGHGLHAATLMGQLRTTLRAYALNTPSAGDVLTHMHQHLIHLQPDDLATALIAQLHPDGRLLWATAGHPQPLLRDGNGEVHTLKGRGLLLGAPFADITHPTHHTRLLPGSTLLMYTDGLIERRDNTLDEGTQRLARTFATATGDLETIADQLLDAMLTDSNREDDTCLLLCHLPPIALTPHDTNQPPKTVAEPST